MPHRKEYLSPKDSKSEVISLLSKLIYNGVFVCVVDVYILFKHKWEQTLPTSKDCIVKHWQPIQKVNLSWESIEECKVELRKDQDYVLVEIVTDHFGYSSVTPSTMYK